jgi:hypothetical protein
MSDFVAQCREEWRRLGVADSLAEEMSADLASDLEEAAAEGISSEEFLGSSALDPCSFAASWAAERGVIPEPAGRGNARRLPRVLVVFTALAAITLAVAAVLLATGEPKVSLVGTSRTNPPALPSSPTGSVVPPGPGRHVLASASAAAPIEWVLLFLAIAALGFAAWQWSSWGRSRPTAARA